MTQNRHFMLAYDISYPEKSFLLNREELKVSDKFSSGLDFSDFVGRGLLICEAIRIRSLDEANDSACEIIVEDQLVVFEVREILERFVSIEGEVEAGIYKFYEDEPEYFEIKDAIALSQFFDEEPNFDHTMGRLVATSDGITVYSAEEADKVLFFQRHPLTFFDIFCPLCSKKVVTYERVEDSLYCREVFRFCQHFVGCIVWYYGGYFKEPLDELDVNYRLSNGVLYLETSEGWQKSIVYAPPLDPVNSYWDGSLTESSGASHFVFIDSVFDHK